MPPSINLEKCIKCAGVVPKEARWLCIDYCPGDCIATDTQRNVPIVTYPDECWHCGICREVCPAKCITIEFPVSMLV